MKKTKFLKSIITISEVITIFIMINKANVMIVTLQDWFEFMIVFSSILLDLVYNKM